MRWYSLGDLEDVDHMMKFTDTSFYIVGRAPSQKTSFRRVDISDPSTPSLIWGKYMTWLDGTGWLNYRSNAVISTDGTKVYTITAIGGPTNKNAVLGKN